MPYFYDFAYLPITIVAVLLLALNTVIFLPITLVLVTKWVDKHTIPYTINNLSVLTP